MSRRTVHFTGHVQGVGFRYTAQLIASRYGDIRGYVRNLHDGRVELVMEGPDDQMDGVMQGVQQQMEGHIRQARVQTSPATGEFRDFSIRH
jgi:acylphosphatase